MQTLKIKGSMAPYQGKAILTTQIKIKDLLNYYKVDPSVQRDLGYHRLSNIKNYLDSMDNEYGIFFPAIVLSFREDPTPYWDKESGILSVPSNLKFAVMDGQHRIEGIERYLNDTTVSSEKRNQILESSLTTQIYFGLTQEDERRLFTDINTKGKKVSRSLITKFDNRDILNVLVRELHNTCDALQTKLTVEFEKSRIVRPQNNTWITSVRLKKFILILLFGESSLIKNTLNKKQEKLIRENYDEIFSFLNKFFMNLAEVLPDLPGDVHLYVLGHEAIQSAIALYIHQAIIIDNNIEIKWISTWEEDVEQLKKINWSVKNPDWVPYMMLARKGSVYEYKQFISVRNFVPNLKEIIVEKVEN